jgi:hypothetical protein
MGVLIATHRVACSTSAGDQTITTTKLKGMTPSAAIVFISGAVTDGTAADHLHIGVGFADSAGNYLGISSQSEHGSASSDCDRRSETTEMVIKLLDGTKNVDGEANFKNWTTNGVVITWGNAPASAFLMEWVFFAGSDVQSYAGYFTAAALDTAADVTDPGFEPDVVLLASNYRAFSGSGTYAYISLGAAINDAGTSQCASNFYSANAAAASDVSAIVSDAYAGAHGSWRGEIGDYDSSGFSCTSRGAGSTSDRMYLALKFNNAAKFSVGTFQTRTSGGDQSITAPAFQPQFVMVGLTQIDTLDTVQYDGDAGAWGVSIMDATDQYSLMIGEEDAADTTNTQSLMDDVAVNFPLDDGTGGHAATLTNFNSTGWTWNYSAADGTAKYWWYLAIERVRRVNVTQH